MGQYVQLAAAGLSAFGAFKGGREDSSALLGAARAEERDAYATEEMQRRSARQFLGTQAAAIAQAGTGYGGTTENVMDQSAIMAELDAINIRNRGLSRASVLRAEAKAAKKRGGILGGAQLLSGLSQYATSRKIEGG